MIIYVEHLLKKNFYQSNRKGVKIDEVNSRFSFHSKLYW